MTILAEWYPIYLKDEGSDPGKFPYHPFDEGVPPANKRLGARGYPAQTGGSVEGATQAPVIV
jgi:hypothetical protein